VFVLARKIGENIVVGGVVRILVLQVRGNKVRIGIDAPNDIRVFREEVYLEIQEQKSMDALSSY
jgi:carbon storage regulator